MEFLQCLGLGRVAHPGILLQTVLEGLLQVLHQTVDALLAGLREVVLDVELADGLAQTFADGGDGTLPAGLLLLHAGDDFVGLKGAVDEGIAEEAGVGLNDVQLHVRLQVLDARLSQHFLYLVQRVELTDVHHVDVLRQAHCIAISCPIDALEVSDQLLPRHQVVRGHRVATCHLVECLHTYFIFYGPLGLHLLLGGGIAVAHHLQIVLIQALDGGDGGLLLLVGLIVVLLGQRGTAMSGVHHIFRRVKRIQTQTEAEGSSIKALGIEGVHQSQRLVAALHLAHLLQVRHNRLVAHLVTADAVHIEAVKRTYLLSVRTLRQILFLGVCHDEFVDAVIVQFVQIDKRSVLRVLSIQRVRLQPSAYGVLPEVITRFYTRVHVLFQILCRASQVNKSHGCGEKHFSNHCLNMFIV